MLSLVLLAALAQAPPLPPAQQGESPGARNRVRGPQPGAPSGEPGSIQGRVYSVAGNPLKRAMVLLRRSEGGRGRPQAAVTDATGAFSFSSVEPGQYNISADRTGFVRQEYGQKKPNKAGVVVPVGPRQEVRDIIFRMIPGAVITGRAVDEDGERMANVRVSIFRPLYQNGRRRLVPANGTMTNDLGEYRLHGIAPGRYYLGASVPMNGIAGGTVMLAPGMRTTIEAPAEMTYGSLFYPNAPDAARAVPIEVTAGGELQGIDFNFQPVRTVRVKGKLTGYEVSAKGGNRPMVMLSPRDTGADVPTRNSAEVDVATGAFEFRGVIPGSYTLLALMSRDSRQHTARMPIDVGGSNVEGLNLAFPPEIHLGGKLRIEGQNVIGQNRFRVLLEPRDSVPMIVPGQAPVQADGALAFINLSPEDYLVNVAGLSEDLFLKSVKAGSFEIGESSLDLRGGSAPESLEIVIGANGGRVEGIVLNEKQEPAFGATIVVIPEGARRSIRRFYKTATAAEDGRFQIRGMPPGEYKIFAWDDIEPYSYSDPAFLEKYESRGVPVRLREGSGEVVSLKLIPAE